jgi:hypothetical protein
MGCPQTETMFSGSAILPEDEELAAQNKKAVTKATRAAYGPIDDRSYLLQM